MNNVIRKRQGKQSLREFAKGLGMSAAYLSDVLRGNRDPGPRLLEFLRLERTKITTITYTVQQ